ncbi:MAG: kelch repeat-containing protein [Patescibacteria group bacterium]
MSFRFLKTTRRIAQLLIIAQVSLSLFDGHTVTALAQAETASDGETAAEDVLNYSQTHALLLTGEKTDESGNFTVDESDQLINYTGTLLTPDNVVNRDYYQAIMDDDEYSHYANYTKGADYLNLASGRYGHTATVLKDGRVLITGGSDGHKVLQTGIIYDPATNRMTSTSSMTISRVWHSADLLSDGNVLILGGKTAKSSNKTDFEGETATASGEIYLTQENKFISLTDWYARQHINNADGTMLWPRSRHVTVQIPNTSKVLVVGSSEEAIEAATSHTLAPATSSIITGCDSPSVGFPSSIKGSTAVVRVSCGLSNPYPDPSEETTLEVRVAVEESEGNAFGVAGNPKAFVTLTATGDTTILKPRKLFGIIPVGTGVRKTSWTVNPLSNTFQKYYSLKLSRIKYTSDTTGAQTGAIKLQVKFNDNERSYSEIFSSASQPQSSTSTSESSSQPASVNNFLIYDYQGSSDHTVPIGPMTYYYAKTIRQLGHNTSYPTYQETSKLQKYGESQTGVITLYATKQSSLTNSLSEFNKVARALGADIDAQTIITEDFGAVGDAPDGILIINDAKRDTTSSVSDEGEWDDPEGLFAEVFDVATGQSSPLPESLAPNQQATVYALPNGKIIITGGGLSKVYLYNPDTGQLTEVGKLTLPRRGMQVVVKTDTDGQPTTLFFVGGQALDSNIRKLMDELLAKNQLPVDVLDVSQMRMYDQPAVLPNIVGSLAESAQQIRADVQKQFGELWAGSISKDVTRKITAYAKAHDVDPAVVWTAFYPAGVQLITSQYAVSLSRNHYLVVGYPGAAVWDLNTNQVELLSISTRIPANQITSNNSQTDGSSAKIISNSSTLNWDYDGSQLTPLADGTVLITGGTSGLATFEERVGTGGTGLENLAHMSRAWGGSMMIGLGVGSSVAGFPLLGAISLAFGMIVLAADIMIATLNSARSMLNGGKSGYETRTYAKTAVSNWRFMPDPYPNESVGSGDIERTDTTSSDLLAPPKEDLLPSTPAADQQVAGKYSGYKLVVSFDQSTLNPYPNSTLQGTVKVLDKNGNLAPISGGLTLTVGAGNSELVLPKTSTAQTEYQQAIALSASQKHVVLSATKTFATTTDPDGSNSFYATSNLTPASSNGYITSGVKEGLMVYDNADKSQLYESSDESGQVVFSDGVCASRPATLRTSCQQSQNPTLVLNNGMATFTYLHKSHSYDNVTFAVSGMELPNFASGSQSESQTVRTQRLSAPTGYQLVPTANNGYTNRLFKDTSTNKSVNVLEGQSAALATVKTIEFADPKVSSLPQLASEEITTKTGYRYTIVSSPSQLTLKQGDKFTITVAAQPDTGKSLPADVYDSVTLKIMAGYQVYNRNYTPPSSLTKGGFIITRPALMVVDSEINKNITGGWTRPPGEFDTINFAIGKEPVTIELQYTGEPVQSSAISLDVVVRDSICRTAADRFKVLNYTPSSCYGINGASLVEQTIHEIIRLPVSQ